MNDSTHNASQSMESLEGRMLLHGGGFADFGPNLVATADFNGDKKADLVSMGNGWRGQKSLNVQLGKGNGIFVAWSTSKLKSDADAITTGDFNKDGNVDVALISQLRGGKASVQVLLGDGVGNLGAASAATALGVMGAANVAGGDINGDGFYDLVSYNDKYVWVALNDGAGALLPAVQQDNPWGDSVPVALGDLDGDTRPDLLGKSGDALIGNKALAATGEFMLTFVPTFGSTLSLSGKKLVIADVDGDGANDVVAIGRNSVDVALQDTSAVWTFKAWVHTDTRFGMCGGVVVADINGDGKADVMQGGLDVGFASYARLTLMSNGDGTFTKMDWWM